MATLTLTATVEADTTPPRVLLEVTDTGSPAITEVTILRLDANGRSTPVRTADAGPLPLTASAASVYDYEMAHGTEVTYYIEDGGNPSAAVTVPGAAVWLIHTAVPSRSVTLRLAAGSNQQEEWPIDAGRFDVLERVDPVVVTSGARRAPASSLIVKTSTQAERLALKALLADGSPLLLNVDPALGIDLDSDYIAVGTVTPARRSPFGYDTARRLELPYQVVGRPAGGTQAALTWDDVAAVGVDDYTADAGSQYLTWQAITDAGVDSWAELAAPTT